jgi:hypothetical protein
MQGLSNGFIGTVLFALSAIGMSQLGEAQDMPPILAPPAAPAVAAPKPVPVAPSAEAVIQPGIPAPAATPAAALPAPVKKPLVATTTTHAAQTHRHAKFAALMKRLTAARTRSAHETATHRVGLHRAAPSLAAGPMPPPPGYYPPGFRQRLVYGGPPPGFYPWAGYRGRYPYDYP